MSDLEKLVDLVAGAAVVEVTVRSGDLRITIRKPGGAPGGAPPTRPGEVRAPAALPAVTAAAAPAAGARPGERWVTAPLVGVFHPAEPPVLIGVRVREGQVVGLIESMRIMSDVRAPEPGVIIEALVEDGMPVEFGQPLFALHPSD
ncbi:MAG: acetyl-CoA carboxylase biotin carboxyl carrier protein [Chthonomonadales bacterium]|nr:acetyl-CoA carboxylase biotin carboxyl carrier protein [Chthonomonadales bacterium]